MVRPSSSKGFQGYRGTPKGRVLKPSTYYRDRLDARLVGGGANPVQRPGSQIPTSTVGAGETPMSSKGKGKSDPAGADPGGSPDPGGGGTGGGAGGGQNGDPGVDPGNDPNCNDNYYFYFGLGGFGFGYYSGLPWYGYYGSFYYPYYCGFSYYYPYYGGVFYPYYWSYAYYPYYRSHYYSPVVTYVDSGPVGGYLPRHSDDPYVEPETVPDFETGLGDGGAALAGMAVLKDPILVGASQARNFEEAIESGNQHMKQGHHLQAAEAYRQAWNYRHGSDPLLRMSVALLGASDFTLSSWCLARGVEDSQRQLLDVAVLMDDLLGGPAIARGTSSLERYLVENPNDESANFLVGCVYILTGRAFAGRMILDRLRSSDFEVKACGAFISHAEGVLEK